MILPLFLAGCGLLEPVRIECTADMPCAQDDSGLDDTGPADTAGDTSLSAGIPQVGFVALVRGSSREVRVYDPTGTVELGAFPAPEGVDGAVDGNPQVAVLAGDSVLWRVSRDSVTMTPLARTLDVVHLDGEAAVGFGANGLSRVTVNGEQTLPGTWGEPVALAWTPGTGGWLVAWTDSTRSGVDAWQLDSTGAPVATLAAFDTTAARGRDVFVGPENAPHGCSEAGAIYRLDRLASSPSPVAFADLGLRNVSACAWDPGDGSWVIFDAGAGFVRIDAGGRARVVVPPPADGTFARGNFH